MLIECTGYDAISLQPNAGSQGEYAGLLAIRRYHESRGDTQRDVCLIPSSAHGTNPASAALAGMRVVIVECDAQGNVDMDGPARQGRAPPDELACIMVTYPSTHGVFEESIVEAVRDRARARRPGVRGRRQPERAGRHRARRASSAPTCRTSTCTRPSASPTAAAARAWARSAWARTCSPSCPAIRCAPIAGAASRQRRGVRRALRQRVASCRSPGPTSR